MVIERGERFENLVDGDGSARAGEFSQRRV